MIEDEGMTKFWFEQTGLRLLTANTGSDQSSIDDGALIDHEEKNITSNEVSGSWFGYLIR